MSLPYRLTWLDSLESVNPDHWNALTDGSPFLRHEFLVALERNGCLREFGWEPSHAVLMDRDGIPMAASPMYLKYNSYGEFVFDWSWASAYEQAGLRYYPKRVSSIPYTPATGSRLLVRADMDDARSLRNLLLDGTVERTALEGSSGAHWLFTTDVETDFLRNRSLTLRMGCQYHWRNEGYRDFDDYLDRFVSRKRKKLKRERQRVAEQDITLRVISGTETTPEQWQHLHALYERTFEEKSGIPTLTLPFFIDISRTMGEQIVLVLAETKSEIVACAICLRSSDTLYGRFWGCNEHYHSLHFEACYYQGLDYCIRHGLQRFEPGAQGEHKIARGFLPTPTWSAHWLADEDFRTPVRRFCERERQAMQERCEALAAMNPFRDSADAQEADEPQASDPA